MFESRAFGERPDNPLSDYEFKNPRTGEDYTSPFPVLVCTVGLKFLGIGQLVGKLDFGDRELPIIEMDDEMAPSGKVHLIGGEECLWEPATAQKIDKIPSQELSETMSPYRYSYIIDVAYQANLN